MKGKGISALVIVMSMAMSFLCSCKRDGFLVSETGLHYTIHESYGKQRPKVGDIMYMHLVYKNAKDSVLFDSKPLGENFAIKLSSTTFTGGLEEAFTMLGEGDSASFLVCADSLYDKVLHAKRPSYIHKGEKLRFEVRLNKIHSPGTSQSAQEKVPAYSASDEDLEIRKYLAENNLLMKARPSGLVYISFIEGKGKRPVAGNEVEIEYTGTFLSGEMFDATDKASGPLKFRLGDGTMIPAWEEGVSLMKEGGKSRFVIPSRLAYGEKGYGPIGPNTSIVYDVVLEKVN